MENYISFERYRELWAELGEKNPEAQEALAGYLHSLGVALAPLKLFSELERATRHSAFHGEG
jgi:hypothetical protein